MREEFFEHGPHRGRKHHKAFKGFGGSIPEEIEIEWFGPHGPGPHGPHGPHHPPHRRMKYGFGGSRRIKQVLRDNTLHVIIHAPGIDKETIRLRAKADKLTFSGKLREDLRELLGDEEMKLQFSLTETVDADSAKADYRDGIMLVSFPVVEEGELIDIE